MYWVRIGSILDLTIMAARDSIYGAAKAFDIPNSTMSGYISGVRNAKESGIEDIAMRWAKYFNSRIRPMIPDWHDVPEDVSAVSQEDIFGLYFHELFTEEDRLRLIYELEPYMNPFGCCAAQVLAQFEAVHPGAAEAFSQEDALKLLQLTILHSGTYSETERQNLIELALRYVLWRVKARENFFIERFGNSPKAFEARDQRPLSVLSEEDQNIFAREPADHRLIRFANNYPDVPRLKRAATIDVLLLCQRVTVDVSHVLDEQSQVPITVCSCVSPFCKKIGFAAATALR
jgi:hypothetical protein